MSYARLIAGTWHEVTGSFTVGDDPDAVHYPAGWLDGASPADRAALGAVAIVEEPPVAASIRLLGQQLTDVDGVPHRRWVLPGTNDVRAARRAELSAIRWARQQKMKWRGRIVDADDTTTSRIMAVVMRAQITGEPDVAIRWKFGDNDYDTLTLADFTAYGLAIGAHLQGCYDREAELVAAIADAAGAEAVAAIDLTTGWPA